MIHFMHCVKIRFSVHGFIHLYKFYSIYNYAKIMTRKSNHYGKRFDFAYCKLYVVSFHLLGICDFQKDIVYIVPGDLSPVHKSQTIT